MMLVVYGTLVSSTFRDILLILPDRSSFSSLPELASTSVTNDAILHDIFSSLKRSVTAQQQQAKTRQAVRLANSGIEERLRLLLLRRFIFSTKLVLNNYQE